MVVGRVRIVSPLFTPRPSPMCGDMHGCGKRRGARGRREEKATRNATPTPLFPPLQLLDRWSLSAIAARLDKRALQQQADTHMLFLVTEHWARLSEGRAGDNDAYARALAEEAEALGHEVRAEREGEREKACVW